jgi:predicted transcriptional regulator YdeE
MNKTATSLNEIKLVGITAITSNHQEMSLEAAKIGKTLDKYFKNHLHEKINHRVKPGTTYCVYTNYETDESGMYTYFVGEEVEFFNNVDPIFEKLTIPMQKYIKFNVGPGKMPTICIDAWKNIWKMTPEDLGAKRAYIADFEVYDEKAKDPINTILDIYIGVKND